MTCVFVDDVARPPEWAAWLAAGERLCAAPPLRRSEQGPHGASDPKFALGDFLAAVPDEHLEALAVALGHTVGQFRIYREVAVQIPPDRRVAASWSVHRDLRAHPELLRDGLTVRQAVVLAGKEPVDSPADQKLSVEDRAEKAWSYLKDPAVKEVIVERLAKSKSEREARKLARVVHSDLAAQQKQVEAELRAAQAAMSPAEATIKSQLKLLEAAQLIHAVGEALPTLEDTDRLRDALRGVAAEAAEALAHWEDPAEGESAVIPGEVWQARSARAAVTADSKQRVLSEDGRVVHDDRSWRPAPFPSPSP